MHVYLRYVYVVCCMWISDSVIHHLPIAGVDNVWGSQHGWSQTVDSHGSKPWYPLWGPQRVGRWMFIPPITKVSLGFDPI